MRKITSPSIIFLMLLCMNSLYAQVSKQKHIPGTPCTDCPAPPATTVAKGGNNQVQNGSGFIATSYTVSACGLNFTSGSVRLNQRSFAFTPATGVAQPASIAISGIPPCFTVVKAFLYVGGSGNGVAITATLKNPANVTNNYPMTMIGSHTDKCWGYTGTYNYRADVTAAISGNGNYVLSGIPCLGGPPNDMDGATLIIIYTDPTQTYTGHMIIGDGCHEASGGTITDVLTGFSVCGATNSTQNFVIVSDLQQIAATAVNLNSATSNYSYPAASNKVWDYIQQAGAPAVAGQTSATYGFSNSSDCYNFVAAGMYYRTACMVCTISGLTVTAVTSSSCSAGSATANVTGGSFPYTYTWSPTGGNAQTVSNVPTGIYTVTVADATGCNKATATVAINAASAPTISIASNTAICPGQSANLTASGASTYTWSPSASLNTPNGPNVVATPAATQIYTVSGANAAGCISTQTVQVTVNPLPVPTIGSNSPVCAGFPINLTSGGGSTYSWSGPNAFSSVSQNPSIPSASSVNAGVYTVTVISAAGCSAVNSVNVAVTTPTTSASNTGPYCAGQTIQLNAPAATSYTWSGPSAFSSNAQNPTIANATTGMSGTYTVIATVSGCTAMATTSVTVNALPTPSPSNTGPYCPGNTIQLNVGAYTSYTWSGPSSFSSNSQNPTQSNAQTTNSGNYIVTVKDANGCVNTGTTNVIVNPTPVVNVGSNSPVCLNNPINLTSSGGTGYSWSGPNAFSSNSQNPTVPNAQVVNAGVYTVTVTALGCTNTGTVNVIVTTPTTSASNTGPYCAGQTIQLNAASATSYTWSGPGGYSSNSQNATQANSVPTMSGTYTLLVTIGTCTATATTSVTVNALPTPSPTNTGPYCPGNTIQLNVSAYNSYTWTGPSSFSSNSQNPTQSNAQTTNGGNYVVTVTDANGCVNSGTTNVVVNPTPVVNVGSNSPVCLNNTINLTSSGGTGYSWSGPASFSSVNQNPTIPNAQVVNAGVYTVTVTALGCTNTGTVNVIVTTPTTSASNTGPYCAGSTIQLNAPSATSYTWSGPGGYSSNSQNATQANSTPVMSGTYTVLVTIGTCTATASTSVTVNALPTPTASNTGPYCPGDVIQLGVGAFSTYTWSGPSSYNSNVQNASLTNAQTSNGGIYTVTVKDVNGCLNTSTTNVVVNPTPVVNISSNSPVCVNASINLTSGGGTSYSWSGPASFSSVNQNPTIPNAQVVNAGVYTVTVTALGCTNTGTTSVTVTTPTTSASNTGPYCAGTTINLSAPVATSYTWSGPGGYSSNAQNATQANSIPSMSGTYSVIVTIGTCTATAVTNVTVNPLPVPTASANSPVCVGQTINLTGGGGMTYTWTGPGSYNSTSQNPSQTNAQTSMAGNYLLVVTDSNNCVDSANVNVVVNALPVIAVNNPTNCVNTTIGLTATGGTAYVWSGPNSYSSNSQNPSIPSAQLNMSGSYMVTVTDANGCVNTANANVTVLPLPTPNITSNSPVCAGQVLNLMGSGGATYMWSGPGYSGPNQNPTINNVTAAANGVYTLLVSSGTCTASTTYTVIINPLPVLSFVNTNVLCNGQSNGTSVVNVSVGTGPYSYTWTSNPPQNTPNATSLSAGTYSCIVTDSNSCTNVASTQITQPTAFSVSINSTTNSACANSPINVLANGSGGTGSYTYSWVSGPSTSLYSINEGLAGSYTYTVDAMDANNCPASNVISLTFFPQPTVTATSATYCAGGSAQLTATGANTYTWQPGNVIGNTYPYNGNTSVSVTVIGSANGCSNSTNANIIVNPNPNAAIATGGGVGCVPTCMTFTGNGSSSVVSYNWTLNGLGITGNQTGTYCFSEAATYSLGLSVMDANGCTATAAPVTLDIYPQPVADFNHAPLKPIINIDQEVTFTDASWGANIVSWNWYFMNTAQYTSTLQNPTFQYTEPGTYAVVLVVKSDKGCIDTLIRPLEVGEDFGIYVPNAFTPNADGLNDIFQPKGFGVVKYELNIFDRWGEKVFHTDKFEEGWDGKYMGRGGNIIEEGVYTWLINCTSVFGKSHELKGHVTLMK